MAEAMTSTLHRGRRARLVGALIVFIWIFCVIVLGYFGYGKAKDGILDRLYYSLQLFVLDAPDTGSGITWQVQIARFLAPLGELIGLTLGIVAAMVWWTDWFRLIGLKVRASLGSRRHVVICGIGNKGLQLVRDFRRKGEPVLIIEKERNNSLIENCDQLGAVVLVGDATKTEVLQKAYLRRAKYLIAICGDDGANVEIAIRAEELLGRRKRSPVALQCYIHIVDLELRTLFRQQKFMSSHASPVQVSIFNIFENSARLLFADHFLDYGMPIVNENDPRQAHLIVVGFGRLGESIALQAVKSTHFPNAKTLRLTVIDKDAYRKHRRFLFEYDVFHELCDARFIQMDPESPTLSRRLQRWCEDPDSIVTVVVAFEDDSHSLSFAVSLLSKLRRYCPIFIRAASDAGLANLLANLKDSKDLVPQVYGFGQLQETCSADVVVNEKLNQFAMRIHADFIEKRKKEGRSRHDPSMREWEKLDPDLKESNWQQVEHIRFKLRAIGCDTTKTSEISSLPNRELDGIDDDDAVKLAKMEHRRWIAERSLAGWRRGAHKDLGMRIHPDLKDWEELSEIVRGYDVEAVRLIPQLVARDNKKIYRKPNGQF